MNNPIHNEVEDDQGEVFLDESDIIHEVTVDDEGFFFFFSFFSLSAYIYLDKYVTMNRGKKKKKDCISYVWGAFFFLFF